MDLATRHPTILDLVVQLVSIIKDLLRITVSVVQDKEDKVEGEDMQEEGSHEEVEEEEGVQAEVGVERRTFELSLDHFDFLALSFVSHSLSFSYTILWIT